MSAFPTASENPLGSGRSDWPLHHCAAGVPRRTFLAAGLALAAFPFEAGAAGNRPKLTQFFAPGDTPDLKDNARLYPFLHEPLRARGLRELTLNAVLPDRTPQSPYAAALELEFDSRAHLDHYRAAPKRITPALSLATNAVIVRRPAEHARAGAKRIGLIGRAAGTTRAQFFADWRNLHAEDVLQQPDLAGYLLNMAAEPDQGGWDGYAELWWPDWARYDASMKVRLQQASTAGFFARRLLLLVEELVHLGPAGIAVARG